FRFLGRRLGRDRAEDAFQDTFLRALRAYPRLEHGEHLRAWVLTIASRIVLDDVRRRRPPNKELAELPELASVDGRPAFEELAPRPERGLDLLARLYGSRVLRASRPVDRLRLELDEYFEGRRRHFDVETDVRVMPEFNRRVLAELARVEYGDTTTYGALAARVGNARAARAVGTVMNRNPVPIVLPCHRVVGASGKLVGYGGGLDRKEWLLRLEGALL